MNTEDRIERARALYEQAVYGGDAAALTAAEKDLDSVAADVALARGRILHTRFLLERERTGSPPAEDPNELSLFQHAFDTYQALGDVRGQAEALFWIGTVHQVIRRDNDTAVPLFQQAYESATRVGDKWTQSEALRHLGIAAHMVGSLDEARDRLEESSRLRREIGLLPGVAANMVGLAYLAAAAGRRTDAQATLDEAQSIAESHGAHAVVRQIQEARSEI